MSGTIPPLPKYAFMARCSVKAQGQLYLNNNEAQLMTIYFNEYICICTCLLKEVLKIWSVFFLENLVKIKVKFSLCFN
jgi:hypothetical protein